MKHAATIFLLGLLLSVQTPLGQFLKLPLLIEHYVKHQKQESISFITFLRDHYATDHHDADMPEDEQLPFKDIAFQGIGFAIFAPAIQPNVFVSSPVEKLIVFSDEDRPQQYLDSIFHPPRRSRHHLS